MAIENQLEPGFVNDVFRGHPAIFNTASALGFATSRMLGIFGDQPQDQLDYALLGLQTLGVATAVDTIQYLLSSSIPELKAAAKNVYDMYRDDKDLLQIGVESTVYKDHQKGIQLARRIIERGSSPVLGYACLAALYGRQHDYLEQIHTYQQMLQSDHPTTERHGILPSIGQWIADRRTYLTFRQALDKGRAHAHQLKLEDFIDDVFTLRTLRGSPIQDYLIALYKKEQLPSKHIHSVDPLTAGILRATMSEALSENRRKKLETKLQKKHPGFTIPSPEEIWQDLACEFANYEDVLKKGKVHEYSIGRRRVVMKEGDVSELSVQANNLTTMAESLVGTGHTAPRVLAGPIPFKDRHALLTDHIQGPTLHNYPGYHEFTKEHFMSLGTLLGRLHARMPADQDTKFTFTPYLQRAPLSQQTIDALITIYPFIEDTLAFSPLAPFADAHGEQFIVTSEDALSFTPIEFAPRGVAPSCVDQAYLLGSIREFPTYTKRQAFLKAYFAETKKHRKKDAASIAPSNYYHDIALLLALPHLAFVMHEKLSTSLYGTIKYNAKKALLELQGHKGFFKAHQNELQTIDSALTQLPS